MGWKESIKKTAVVGGGGRLGVGGQTEESDRD